MWHCREGKPSRQKIRDLLPGEGRDPAAPPAWLDPGLAGNSGQKKGRRLGPPALSPSRAFPSAGAAGPVDRRAQGGIDPRLLLVAEMAIGADPGERVFEMLRRRGGRSALPADDDPGLLVAFARALLDLLPAVAVDQPAGAVHFEPADPGAAGMMLALAVADDLEPADPLAFALVPAALAVVDNDEPLHLLAVAFAVRMRMGQGGAAGSGEEQGRGGEAEFASLLHRFILPLRASGC